MSAVRCLYCLASHDVCTCDADDCAAWRWAELRSAQRELDRLTWPIT